ncbi:unnamed protein product [Spirodela intermedia]|uniref:SWIRM domain-containing protein n=1 Tax=Spirodela intermedia TaxID=51605 RepID=A0A7I8IMR1_SPIIN|nr:unnamed protein product [Spirodela intermedia]CAA6658426.1 unnamed protein product [Spirodela intermedia]
MSPEKIGEAPRRSVRAAAAARKVRSYDEAALDDLLQEHIGPANLRRRRNRTLEERERETETEAMIALSLGFPIDALTEEELRVGVLPSGANQNDYIVLRNHILARWREDVRSSLTKPRIRETVSAEYDALMCRAFDFLLEQGYINFGVSPAARSRSSAEEHPNRSVVVVGAGLAGLAAAGQLLSFGFKVVYTQKMAGPGGAAVAVDLGGSVITGIHANPLGVLARQLGVPLHNIRWENCPLYGPDGAAVDQKLDAAVDSVFNKLLEKASQLRERIGESAGDISLGSAMETLRRLYGVAKSHEERELLDWHLANLEYANAGCLSDLSLAYWDQDDPYEMGGDHCFLAGGNWRLIHAMAADVPILYGKTVTSIRHGDSGVEVVAGDQRFLADMALCTVPLGVLKSGALSFDPPLPPRKLEAIARLGFGLLNKIAMVFPYAFWGEDTDTFGCLNQESRRRGEFFLFYCYHTVAGGPVIIALVAGEAAVGFEKADPVTSLHRVLGVLRGICSRKGIHVPDPIQTACTRWRSDPLCRGSYSHIRVGSSGRDYDVLAENVGGRLFFAGEATSRQYPATMHGAFLSGLREAASILRVSGSRAAAQMEVKKCLHRSSKLCHGVLADLFRKPDLSSGNFSFGRGAAEDHHPAGHRRSANPSSALHLYTFVSRDQAEELQLVSGEDAARLSLLCKDFRLKLMGRSSLCDLGSSLITAIDHARRGRRRRLRPADAAAQTSASETDS